MCIINHCCTTEAQYFKSNMSLKIKKKKNRQKEWIQM